MITVAPQHVAVGQRLATELADAEARFTAELLSDLPPVNRLVEHVERYRGKMLRPTLVLLSGLATAPRDDADMTAHRVVAAVVEMVHMATLVHDDVLDDAAVRRGGRTVHELEGNETAVMLGDYLISHAYHLCSGLGDTEVSRLIADTTNTVCEGELLQLANRGNWELDERTYFEVIRRKTASLVSVCCRLGGVLHGAAPAHVDRLGEYGEKVGIAFQIVDDLLDLVGQEERVGKSLGRDLHKGKLTLPLIRFLHEASPIDRRRLRELGRRMGGEAADEAAALAEVRALLAESDAVAYARRWAQELVDMAKAAVAQLPPTPARALLLDMADAVVTRQA